ncbi:MAG: hypothetical protein KatS3mg023_1814 [Armatimonadota bacterium]|nr:MAG: hypothetical protein KatS3mg023_1814 [Armatimonadota bacterium]
MNNSTSIVSDNRHKSQQVDNSIHDAFLQLLQEETDRLLVSCPCAGHNNNDANPSLQIGIYEKETRAGKVVKSITFKCWSQGHTAKDVLQVVGEETFIRAFCEWKGLDAEFVLSTGMVHAEADEYQVYFTFTCKDASFKKTIDQKRYRHLPKFFRSEKGFPSSEALFYPLPAESDYILLCEGETDALALASAGFHVAGAAGKSNYLSSNSKILHAMKRFQRVYLLVEADVQDAEVDAVKKHPLLEKTAVFVIRMQGTGFKDACEMMQAMGNRARFRDVFQQLMDDAERLLPEPRVDYRKQALESQHHQDVQDSICINDANLAAITKQAWEILAKRNHPPRLFKRGHTILRLSVEDQGGRQVKVLQEVDKNILINELSNNIFFYETRLYKGKSFNIPSTPSERLALNMLSEPAERIPLPALYRLVHAPTFDRDGNLLAVDGYHAGVLVDMGGLKVPTVSMKPTREEVQQAVGLLREMMIDFPFVSEADRAHAIALILNPFIREMIDGPTPLFLIDAPAPGTGKSKLVQCCLCPAVGANYTIMQYTPDATEMDKRILSFLRSGKPVAFFDNVKVTISSAPLEVVLTSYPSYSGRLLGKSETVTALNNVTWVLTANNPQAGTEIARRSVSIMMDAGMENPYERTGFKHHLPAWAFEHRGELVWAALTIIQNWIAQGKPRWQGRTLGSFEIWSEVMGGVLECAGIPGFLDNLHVAMEKHDSERMAWTYFIRAWWDTCRDQRVTIRDLVKIAEDITELNMPDGSERAKSTWLGKHIQRNLNRPRAGFVIIEKGADRDKARSFSLKPAENCKITNESAERAEHAELLSQCSAVHIEGSNSGKQVPHVPHVPHQPEVDEDPFADGEPAAVDAGDAGDRTERSRVHIEGSNNGNHHPHPPHHPQTCTDEDPFADGEPAKDAPGGDVHLFMKLLDAAQQNEKLAFALGRILVSLRDILLSLREWEARRVEYSPDAQELLSCFVDDVVRFCVRDVQHSTIRVLLHALFTLRGLEVVQVGNDAVVHGARLKHEPPQPQLPLDVSPDEPKKDRQQARIERAIARAEETLDSLDYNIPEHQEHKEMVTMTDKHYMILNKTRVPVIDDPEGVDIPEVELPDAPAWSTVKCAVIDIETSGLDPYAEDARILAIGWKDTVREHVWSGENEYEILRRFLLALKREQPDIVAGHNIMEFDLPYIIARCRAYGLHAPFRIANYTMKVGHTSGTLRSEEITFHPVWYVGQDTLFVDTLHLVCRYDYFMRTMSGYDLKTAARELCGRERQVTLDHDNIHRAFESDPETFRQYLIDDLRDAWALLETLAPAHHYIACMLDYPYHRVWTAGFGSVWENLLERYYNISRDAAYQMAEPKRTYRGGMVIGRSGFFKGCSKIDVSSLYPTVMLQYGVHSKKDTERISLAYLKRMTEMRLELKARAKAGDKEADFIQEGLKRVINSKYGFLGSEMGFNDMDAAERVTTIGRSILLRMVTALEQAGCVVVEADTDGIIVQHPEEIDVLSLAQSVLPAGFKLELDWSGKTVFVMARKNYIVFNADGSIHERKGIAYRSRDRNALSKECMIEFLRKLIVECEDAARQYAREILHRVSAGEAWELVVERKRVSDKNMHKGYAFEVQAVEAGYAVGDKVECAYLDEAKKRYSFRPEDGYDRAHYAREWVKSIRETLNLIHNPKSECTTKEGEDDVDAG